MHSSVSVAADGAITYDDGRRRYTFAPDGAVLAAEVRDLDLPLWLAGGIWVTSASVTVGTVEVPWENGTRVVPAADGVWLRARDRVTRVGPTGALTTIDAPGWGDVAPFDGGVAWADDRGLHVRGAGSCDVPGLSHGALAVTPDGGKIAVAGPDSLLLLDGACAPIAALPVATEGVGFAGDRVLRLVDGGAVLHDGATLAPLTRPPGPMRHELATRAVDGHVRFAVGLWEWDPADGTSAPGPALVLRDLPPDVRVLGGGHGSGVRVVPGGVQVFDPVTLRDRGPVLPVRPTAGIASADGRFAVTLADGAFTAWDVATARPRWSVPAPANTRIFSVDAHHVRIGVGSEHLLLRTSDGEKWGTARVLRAGGEDPYGLVVWPAAGAPWDSRRPAENRLSPPPAADAPAPTDGPPVVDALGAAFARGRPVPPDERACADADALRARWDVLPAIDAAFTAALDEMCPRFAAWAGTPIPWPAPVPATVGPAAGSSPRAAPQVVTAPPELPLRTDVPTVIVRRHTSGEVTRTLTDEGLVVYEAAPFDVGTVELTLDGAPVAAHLLPGAGKLLDGLGVPAALVDTDGTVLAAGTLGEVVAAARLGLAGITRLDGGWVAPAWTVALPETMVELLPLEDGALVRTRGEVARVGGDGRARWQVPGVFASVVPDGDRVWVEPRVGASFAVALADGRRVADGAVGRAVPGDPVRFRRDLPGGIHVDDADGRSALTFPARGITEVTTDELRFRVGPFVGAVSYDGRFRGVTAATPREVRWGRRALVEDGARIVDARGRVVVERVHPGTLVAAGDHALVQAHGPQGPWLLLDRRGRAVAVYDATRVVPAAGGLLGGTRAGLARWELP